MSANSSNNNRQQHLIGLPSDIKLPLDWLLPSLRNLTDFEARYLPNSNMPSQVILCVSMPDAFYALHCGNRGRDTVESAREGKFGVQMGRSMLEALKRAHGPLNDFVDVKCGEPMKLDSLG